MAPSNADTDAASAAERNFEEVTEKVEAGVDAEAAEQGEEDMAAKIEKLRKENENLEAEAKEVEREINEARVEVKNLVGEGSLLDAEDVEQITPPMLARQDTDWPKGMFADGTSPRASEAATSIVDL